MNLSRFLLLFISISFSLSACTPDKPDTFYQVRLQNNSSYRLLATWETKQDQGQKFVESQGNNASLSIFSGSNKDVGDLGAWKEGQFYDAIKKVKLQRLSQTSEWIDTIPKDFSDFRHWKLQKGRTDDFVGGLEYTYDYTLEYTDSTSEK